MLCVCLFLFFCFFVVVFFKRRFVLRLALCYFVLVLFSPLIIANTSLGEERERERERDNLSAVCTFVRFALVWFYLFPLPLGVFIFLTYLRIHDFGFKFS